MSREPVSTEGGESTSSARRRRLGLHPGWQQSDEAQVKRDEDRGIRHESSRTWYRTSSLRLLIFKKKILLSFFSLPFGELSLVGLAFDVVD